MVVDGWGFDADRQARARDLRRGRLRLSVARTVASGLGVLALILRGSFLLRVSVLSFHWPSWASSVLPPLLLSARLLSVHFPLTFLCGCPFDSAAGLRPH